MNTPTLDLSEDDLCGNPVASVESPVCESDLNNAKTCEVLDVRGIFDHRDLLIEETRQLTALQGRTHDVRGVAKEGEPRSDISFVGTKQD